MKTKYRVIATKTPYNTIYEIEFKLWWFPWWLPTEYFYFSDKEAAIRGAKESENYYTTRTVVYPTQQGN
jgi:hypothetical protein